MEEIKTEENNNQDGNFNKIVSENFVKNAKKYKILEQTPDGNMNNQRNRDNKDHEPERSDEKKEKQLGLENTFVCPFCEGKPFPFSRHLKQHLDMHMKSGKKQYHSSLSDICQIISSNWVRLKYHFSKLCGQQLSNVQVFTAVAHHEASNKNNKLLNADKLPQVVQLFNKELSAITAAFEENRRTTQSLIRSSQVQGQSIFQQQQAQQAMNYGNAEQMKQEQQYPQMNDMMGWESSSQIIQIQQLNSQLDNPLLRSQCFSESNGLSGNKVTLMPFINQQNQASISVSVQYSAQSEEYFRQNNISPVNRIFEINQQPAVLQFNCNSIIHNKVTLPCVAQADILLNVSQNSLSQVDSSSNIPSSFNISFYQVMMAEGVLQLAVDTMISLSFSDIFQFGGIDMHVVSVQEDNNTQYIFLNFGQYLDLQQSGNQRVWCRSGQMQQFAIEFTTVMNFNYNSLMPQQVMGGQQQCNPLLIQNSVLGEIQQSMVCPEEYYIQQISDDKIDVIDKQTYQSMVQEQQRQDGDYQFVAKIFKANNQVYIQKFQHSPIILWKKIQKSAYINPQQESLLMRFQNMHLFEEFQVILHKKCQKEFPKANQLASSMISNYSNTSNEINNSRLNIQGMSKQNSGFYQFDNQNNNASAGGSFMYSNFNQHPHVIKPIALKKINSVSSVDSSVYSPINFFSSDPSIKQTNAQPLTYTQAQNAIKFQQNLQWKQYFQNKSGPALNQAQINNNQQQQQQQTTSFSNFIMQQQLHDIQIEKKQRTPNIVSSQVTNSASTVDMSTRSIPSNSTSNYNLNFINMNVPSSQMQSHRKTSGADANLQTLQTLTNQFQQKVGLIQYTLQFLMQERQPKLLILDCPLYISLYSLQLASIKLWNQQVHLQYPQFQFVGECASEFQQIVKDSTEQLENYVTTFRKQWRENPNEYATQFKDCFEKLSNSNLQFECKNNDRLFSDILQLFAISFYRAQEKEGEQFLMDEETQSDSLNYNKKSKSQKRILELVMLLFDCQNMIAQTEGLIQLFVQTEKKINQNQQPRKKSNQSQGNARQHAKDVFYNIQQNDCSQINEFDEYDKMDIGELRDLISTKIQQLAT